MKEKTKYYDKNVYKTEKNKDSIYNTNRISVRFIYRRSNKLHGIAK